MKPKTIISTAIVVLLVALNYFFPGLLNDRHADNVHNTAHTLDNTALNKLVSAHQQQQSKVWFQGVEFRVVKLLNDDNKGSRHQRFFAKHPPLPQLLVAHNIDLVERIPMKVGDKLIISGRYEWNNKGGVIHWTHHDPNNKAPGGWIDYQGRRYQ